MNTLILACLLYSVCSAIGALRPEVTFSPELSRVSGGPASGEGLPGLLGEDDDLELPEDLSVGTDTSYLSHERLAGHEERKKRKGKGKRKNKHRSKSTTAFNPVHPLYTSDYTSTHTTTEDPCASTHLGFCIHGFCKYMEDLREPVCVCMKGFDGERCGIQTLETGKNGEKSEAEVVQTVLVIIAVVLSVISCTAILLMTCAHYRSHKNFMAAYLGTGAEVEKLQKPMASAMV